MRENKRAGARKVMIEKRKEDAERQLALQERREEEDRLLQARLAEATEEERRRQERCAVTGLIMPTGVSGCSEHLGIRLFCVQGVLAPSPDAIRRCMVNGHCG